MLKRQQSVMYGQAVVHTVLGSNRDTRKRDMLQVTKWQGIVHLKTNAYDGSVREFIRYSANGSHILRFNHLRAMRQMVAGSFL